MTCGPKGRFYQMKGNGMVRDVLDPSALQSLVGSMGIGHGQFSRPKFLPSSRRVLRVSVVFEQPAILLLGQAKPRKHNPST